MKLVKTAIFLLSVMLVGTTQAASINERQHNQKQRIHQGVKNGELTKAETRALTKNQIDIAKKEKRFRSDGHFSRKERAIIQRDLERTNHQIYKQKHDSQSR